MRSPVRNKIVKSRDAVAVIISKGESFAILAHECLESQKWSEPKRNLFCEQNRPRIFVVILHEMSVKIASEPGYDNATRYITAFIYTRPIHFQ